MNSNQKQFNAFLESICTVSGHTDILPALKEGFKTYCEGIDMDRNYENWHDDTEFDQTYDEAASPMDDEMPVEAESEGIIHPGAPASDKIFVNNHIGAYYDIWNEADELCGVTRNEVDGGSTGKLRAIPNLRYGSFVNRVAHENGMSVDEVKRLVNIFYASMKYINVMNSGSMDMMDPKSYGPYKCIDRFAADPAVE